MAAAHSPLYDAAELNGVEKEVESLFCGTHVEGRSTTIRKGQAGNAEKLEDIVCG